jgi:hypothetical protein
LYISLFGGRIMDPTTAARIAQKLRNLEAVGKELERLRELWSAELSAGKTIQSVVQLESELAAAQGALATESPALVATVQAQLTAATTVSASAGRSIFGRLGAWILRKVAGDSAAALATSSALTTAVGVIAVTAVLGVVTYGVANYLGSRASDVPIQPGPRMSQPAATAVQAPPSSGSGPYYIYSLNLSGPNVYIGTQADTQQPSCHFQDGGTCGTNDANVTVLSTIGGPYDTKDLAINAYCGMVTGVHDAFGGTKGYINGVDYWLDNAPSCPAATPTPGS